MTDPTPNVALLRKAVEWVEAEAARPEIERQWRQGSWITPASSKAHLMLYSVPFYENAEGGYYEREALADRVAEHCGTAYCVAGYIGQLFEPAYIHDTSPNGLPHVSVFAASALGISEEQADDLFNGANSAERVREIAEDIAGERL